MMVIVLGDPLKYKKLKIRTSLPLSVLYLMMRRPQTSKQLINLLGTG